MRTFALSLALLAGCEAHPDLGPFRPDGGEASRTFLPLRMMTWNLETVGAPGSAEYLAALDVLERLDCQIVALQEIASETDAGYANSLAADAGYTSVTRGWPVSFGADHTMIFAKRGPDAAFVLDAFDLSPDPNALDITRSFARVDFNLPSGRVMTVMTNHFKALNGDEPEFRRSVEAARAVQALADRDPQTEPVVFFGDLNEDDDDLPLSPPTFTALPNGLPQSYRLGSDLQTVMNNGGIVNNPFLPLESAGLIKVAATTRRGDDATLLGSTATLDHVYLSPDVTLFAQEIYDSEDEGLPTRLHLNTSPLPAGTLATASDHRPVVVELKIDK